MRSIDHDRPGLLKPGLFYLIFCIAMNIMSFAQAVGMDYEEVMEDCCGDTQVLQERIEAYLPSADFEGLMASIDRGDEVEARSRAHKIRGLAEKLSLKETTRLAGRLEKAPADRLHAFKEPLGKEASIYKKALEEQKDPDGI